jgi:hypothetical protein
VSVTGQSFVFVNSFEQRAVIGVKLRIRFQVYPGLKDGIECIIKHASRDIGKALGKSFFAPEKILFGAIDD